MERQQKGLPLTEHVRTKEGEGMKYPVHKSGKS